jgi:hypothetical protein
MSLKGADFVNRTRILWYDYLFTVTIPSGLAGLGVTPGEEGVCRFLSLNGIQLSY